MYSTSKTIKNRQISLVGFALLAFAAAGLAGWAAPAHAYRMIQDSPIGLTDGVTCNDSGGFVHWSISHIPWYLNPAGFGGNKALALQAAMQSWTDVHVAGHVLDYLGTTTSGFATDNKNTIMWSPGNGCSAMSCVAVTALTFQSNQVIVEADISFNANWTWNTNGFDYDTQAVATHELGHSLGIQHTDKTYTPRPTMWVDYFGLGGRSLESDDITALICSEQKYPVSPPPPPPPFPCNPLQCFVQCNGYGGCTPAGQCNCYTPP